MVKNTPGPEPHRAIYGFSFNLFFTSLFSLYVIWVLPYQAFGFTKHFYFVPDTYFAFSWPVFILCGIFFFLFFYLSVNMAQTADMECASSMVDSKTNCECLRKDKEIHCESNENVQIKDIFSVPASYAIDIDLSLVSKVLYNKN